MKKMDGKTADLVEENVSEIKRLFPSCIREGKVDFDSLRSLLEKEGKLTDEKEKYSFTWYGKQQSKRTALQQNSGTLRPVRSESVDFDSTKNMIIEGDNLEVLRLLLKPYSGKIKMIYIDPPYNTGKDFIYKDDFSDNLKNYIDKSGQALESNPESKGRFHSNWLNMMYPRLMLARNLLSDDGVIFVSIDDNEVHDLRFNMNEIFGEENLLAELVWNLGTGTTAGHFTRSHEYILCYAKEKNTLQNFSAEENAADIQHGALKKISAANPASVIEFPAGLEYEGDSATFTGEIGGNEKEYIISDKLVFEKGRLKFPVKLRAGWAMKNQVLSWLSGKETIDSKGQKIKRFYFNKQGVLWYEKERETTNPKTVLSGIGSTKQGSTEISELLGPGIFPFPKPSLLIKFFVGLVVEKEGIILDFFAGSGTTAHAILAQNAEDYGNRKFVLVQLPEQTTEDSEAFKAGYKTIAEICKERVRRVIKKIKDEIKQSKLSDQKKIDLGFKVFKLDSTNIWPWDPSPKNIQDAMEGAVSNIKDDRSEEDVLYEILLKYGVDLTASIKAEKIDGKTVYNIGEGYLYVCLDKNITKSVIEHIVKGVKSAQTQDTARVVFADACFKDDQDAVNAELALKKAGVEGICRI